MKLKYDLEVTGTANVSRALDTVERRFDKHVNRVNRKAGVRPGQAGVASTPGGEAMNSRRLQEGVQRFLHKQQMGQIKNEERARIAQERNVLREKLATDKKSERERLAGERRTQRERLANARREHRTALTSRRNREAFTRRSVGFVGNSVGSSLRTIGGSAATVLGFGGAAIAADSVRKTARAEKTAAQLANVGFGVNGETRSREKMKADILNQARAEGIRTGLGTEDTLETLKNYQAKSGLVKEGQMILPFLGDLSDAFNADLADTGRTAGLISQALNLTQGMSGAKNVETTKQIMSNVAGQSKVGSIDFPDMATLIGSLISASASFEGNIVDLANTMGAVGQMSMVGGADSPREAMTALKRMSDDMIKHGDKGFKDAGVEVWANKEKTALRDPADVLFDVLKKTGGNLEQAQSMFDVRSRKAFQPLQKMFVQAGGGQKGFQAMYENLKRFKDASVSPEEVKESAGFVRETSGKKYDIAMAKLQDALGNKLLPALVNLIPAFERLIPNIEKGATYFTKFIEALVKNPLGTIFAMVALKAAADVAAAGIGKAISAAAVGAVNRVAGMLGMPGGGGRAPGAPVAGALPAAGGTVARTPGFFGAPTAAGVGAAVGGGAAIGLTVATAIMTTGVANIIAGEANMEQGGDALKRARAAAAAGDVEGARQAYQQLSKMEQTANTPGFIESVAGKDVAKWVDPNLDVERKTVGNFADEGRRMLILAEQNAAKAQAEAAAAQKTAADATLVAAGKLEAVATKYGVNMPNRSDKPSGPVK